MLKLLNPRHYRISELEAESGLSRSAIRYYLNNVLDDYVRDNFGDLKVTERKAALYPAEILDRLRFIKKAKEELKLASGSRIEPTIKELKTWMAHLTEDEVRNVLYGSETLEFGVAKVEDGIRVIETAKGEILPEDTIQFGRQIPSTSQVSSNQIDELQVVDKWDTKIDDSDRHRTSSWQVIALAPEVEIRHKMNLSPRKKKQISLAAMLLQTILEEE